MKILKPGCLYLILLACLALLTLVHCENSVTNAGDDPQKAKADIAADVSYETESVRGLKDRAVERIHKKNVLPGNPSDMPAPMKHKIPVDDSGLDAVEVGLLVSLSDNTRKHVTKDNTKHTQHNGSIKVLPEVKNKPISKMHLLPLKRTDLHNNTLQPTLKMGKLTVPVPKYTNDKISMLGKQKNHSKKLLPFGHPSFLEKPKLHKRKVKAAQEASMAWPY